MPARTAQQLAVDTLNALIAGGHFPEKLIRATAKGPRADLEALKAIEEQLLEHYSQRRTTPE
ncbi:hypothetical protein [Pseudomonas typographi]|uniref:Uncharacterized protein n=1 Tax=Pseudomonas typographi TaxID=2715964 RepID=A0ABR7Z9Y8_9PSED|nr:hypothetical protein [Pseudomonas typographi]MBD1554151.1 hypothetical protein [Pseudomonas typographi]MBD1590256.1 hypothetical protein [Pseudomonas typographi]MBD1602375.1 hypothetical protein [Pseudomonas typographi]